MDTVELVYPGEGIAQVVLNRPERLNAIIHESIVVLNDALRCLADDRQCRSL